MRRDEVNEEIKDISFEFFFWFSRFEFALKEGGYLKDINPGANAEPDWDKYIDNHKNNYLLSNEAQKLIQLHPKRQKVNTMAGLEWVPVGLAHCNNDLCKIVTMLKTVRNNLFHGGKHGDEEVDDLERNIELLYLCKTILDQLAELANFEDDYKRLC